VNIFPNIDIWKGACHALGDDANRSKAGTNDYDRSRAATIGFAEDQQAKTGQTHATPTPKGELPRANAEPTDLRPILQRTKFKEGDNVVSSTNGIKLIANVKNGQSLVGGLPALTGDPQNDCREGKVKVPMPDMRLRSKWQG
jgi:hypothetical protein